MGKDEGNITFGWSSGAGAVLVAAFLATEILLDLDREQPMDRGTLSLYERRALSDIPDEV